MNPLPPILSAVFIAGCLYTSSSEKRHAHQREFDRSIEEWVGSANGKTLINEVTDEWVSSAEGQKKVVTLLEENFEVLMWNEVMKLREEGLLGGGGLIALIWAFRERDKRKYEVRPRRLNSGESEGNPPV